MFGYARDHQPCVIFMDEIDAIGGRRFSEGTSADREIQRTLMELLNQLVRVKHDSTASLLPVSLACRDAGKRQAMALSPPLRPLMCRSPLPRVPSLPRCLPCILPSVALCL